MMKYYILLCLFFSMCTINNKSMSDGIPPGTTSMENYGLIPSVSDAGAKLTEIIINNPNINNWYIPAGEYNVKTLLLSTLSGKNIYGDTSANTIFRFNGTEGYPKNLVCRGVKNLFFYNISWENIRMILKEDSKNITFNGNIFYGIVYDGTSNDRYEDKLNNDYFLLLGEYSGNYSTKNVTIKNSVFLRSRNKFNTYRQNPVPDHKQSANENDENYMVRRQYGIRLLTTSNVTISDNIFGLRASEISQAKSFAKTIELQSTIDRAALLMNNENHHYFTTAINTAPNIRTLTSVAQNLTIVNNLFNGWFSRTYHTESLVNSVNGMPRRDDNRFFDHAVYLRGTKKVLFAGNLIRGWANDASGGIKLKSGIDIAIVNNSFKNTGIILARSTELDGTYSNVLVMDNYLKLDDATGSYSMGITFDEYSIKGNIVNESHSSYQPDKIEEMLEKIRYMVFTGNRISQKNINTTWFDGTSNPANNVTLLRFNDISPDLYTKQNVSLSQAVCDSKIQVYNNRYDNPDERIVENRQNNAPPGGFEYSETPFANLHPEAMTLFQSERSIYTRPTLW